ncbi:MAG TPA: LOG family protein [Terriglobales bacterium]
MDIKSGNEDETGIVSLSDERAAAQILVDSTLGLWEVVNNITRLRPSQRERYRVTIFGSARARPGTIAYEETKRLAAALSTMGCDIVTGGGPGLMQAANEGAELGADESHSVGVRIDLPFEQHENPFVQKVFTHRTFFTRLHHFVLASDVYVVAPGGVGTLLETAMVWQLLQVRHLRGTPLILVGKMWSGLLEWARKAMLSSDPPLASSEDLEIPQCVESAEKAIALIREHHETWRSKLAEQAA